MMTAKNARSISLGLFEASQKISKRKKLKRKNIEAELTKKYHRRHEST
jgi:hypothetical protein